MAHGETNFTVLPNLSWARKEVLDLVHDLIDLTDDVGTRAVDRICRLSAESSDAGRRMALLVQLSAALAGTVAIAEGSPGSFCRELLVEELGDLIQGSLAQPATLN